MRARLKRYVKWAVPVVAAGGVLAATAYCGGSCGTAAQWVAEWLGVAP